MERLTKKINKKDYIFVKENEFGVCPNAIATKLGKLEDIEEKLGIDLISLFKYVDDNKIKEFVECFRFKEMTYPSTICKIKIKKDKSEIMENKAGQLLVDYSQNTKITDLIKNYEDRLAYINRKISSLQLEAMNVAEFIDELKELQNGVK